MQAVQVVQVVQVGCMERTVRCTRMWTEMPPLRTIGMTRKHFVVVVVVVLGVVSIKRTR